MAVGGRLLWNFSLRAAVRQGSVTNGLRQQARGTKGGVMMEPLSPTNYTLDLPATHADTYMYAIHLH